MNTSSMVPISTCGGHSAIVNMSLVVNGVSHRVAQMGPDFIFLEKPFNYLPTTASLVLKVDESEEKWDVFLPNGISAEHERVKIG